MQELARAFKEKHNHYIDRIEVKEMLWGWELWFVKADTLHYQCNIPKGAEYIEERYFETALDWLKTKLRGGKHVMVS